MRNRAAVLSRAATALAAAALASSCGSAKTALNGKITAHFTTIAKAQDVTSGALAGTGQFTISGAISEKGTVADYRTVKGNTALIRRVAVGNKGTITFLITIKLGMAVPERWTITSSTKTYKGLHGNGTEPVDNFDSTPATFTMTGTVSQ